MIFYIYYIPINFIIIATHFETFLRVNIHMNTTAKNPTQKNNPAGNKHAGNSGKRKPHNAQRNKPKPKVQVDPNLPPYAFMIIDLTDKSREAKIIRITQLLVHKDGETELTQQLFNNNGVAISDEAYKYHGISADDLKDKPNLDTFNFHAAKNIVVWDGKVSTQLLRGNGIKKTAPIINLQSLARYSEPVPKPISLYNYAKKSLVNKKHVIEFLMQKTENKVTVLQHTFDHISNVYLRLHGVNSAAFLAVVGSCKNKKESEERIKKFLEVKGKMDKSKPNNSAPSGTPSDNKPKRKIIVVKKQ